MKYLSLQRSPPKTSQFDGTQPNKTEREQASRTWLESQGQGSTGASLAGGALKEAGNLRSSVSNVRRNAILGLAVPTPVFPRTGRPARYESLRARSDPMRNASSTVPVTPCLAKAAATAARTAVSLGAGQSQMPSCSQIREATPMTAVSSCSRTRESRLRSVYPSASLLPPKRSSRMLQDCQSMAVLVWQTRSRWNNGRTGYERG